MKIEERNPNTNALAQLGLQPAAARPAGRPASTDGAAVATSGAGSAGRPAATVQLSARARELHAALKAVQDAPDVRAEIVADVRTRLAEGRYDLDSEATAGGILDLQA
jgi:flagellar biosynthesis anti-sigma factor FlgM